MLFTKQTDMSTTWLKNNTLQLRAPEPEDLELMYAMENDTAIWCAGNAVLPYSRYTLRAYLEQSKQDLFLERQARFVITLHDGKSIGMIDLAEFDPLNSRAEVCIGILGKYREKGLATMALELLCEYAMNKLHIHQLYAYINTENIESRKLFEKCGFTEGVILKQWQRSETGYNDVLLVQKIAE